MGNAAAGTDDATGIPRPWRGGLIEVSRPILRRYYRTRLDIISKAMKAR